MYRIENKADAIKQIQKYLIKITENGKIAPTGIYDSATKAEVVRFQQSKNIDVTGAVNYETFTLLYNDCKREVLESDVRRENSEFSFPIKLGDFGKSVFAANELMRIFLENHYDPIPLRSGYSFSRESANAARRIREILMLKVGDYIDEKMYHNMRKYNNLRFLFEQK